MKRPFISKRWHIVPGSPDVEATLCREVGVSPVLARLLVQRGLTTSEKVDNFLNPTLDRLHDPFLLPDAEKACVRLKQALNQKENILVHGDYDGDGVTSAALWTRTLQTLGGKVEVFVPHRKRDGYDIRVPIIEEAQANDVKLIVTTDCGIQRVDEVEHARERGIDVIITDHHTPKTNGDLPNAAAVVNPHRHDSVYPFKDIAGVGVAFKTCEALTRYLGFSADKFRAAYLDLACIGTVTDVMPLLDENRIIVKHGLEALRSTKKPGLKALVDECVDPTKEITPYNIGFGIGPRLNAASRIDETIHALNILLTKDADEGKRLAELLSKLNMERRELLSQMMDEAMEEVLKSDMAETSCLVVSRSSWAGGMVGLVAGRLRERFWRPVVVIGIDPTTGEGRGSARSIEAFNIFAAVDSCSGFLIEYGGHHQAAGLSIAADSVKGFAQRMNEIAKGCLTEEDMTPSLEVAMEIDTSILNSALVREIESLAPFGHDNDVPMFVSRGLPIANMTRMGQDGKHLKIQFRAEGVNYNNMIDALWWNQGEFADTLASFSSLDVCYTMEINEFRGERKIQFIIKDIKPPEW